LRESKGDGKGGCTVGDADKVVKRKSELAEGFPGVDQEFCVADENGLMKGDTSRIVFELLETPWDEDISLASFSTPKSPWEVPIAGSDCVGEERKEKLRFLVDVFGVAGLESIMGVGGSLVSKSCG
jgi:hypothetical protein